MVADSVVVVVVVAAVVVVTIVVGSACCSHLEPLSEHRAMSFALRALVGAQGNTFSY